MFKLVKTNLYAYKRSSVTSNGKRYHLLKPTLRFRMIRILQPSYTQCLYTPPGYPKKLQVRVPYPERPSWVSVRITAASFKTPVQYVRLLPYSHRNSMVFAPSRTLSVISPYGITWTDTARLICAMKVIRMAILQLPRELNGHIHEIKNRKRSRKIKMGLKTVRSKQA